MSIWILFGTILSVKSRSPARASINVFSFCIGMLITYYITAELVKGVYSMTFIYGWAAFSLLSPIFAYLAWFSRGRGWIAKGISCGILFCMLLCAVLLFDKIRLSDLILLFLTALFLFVPSNGKAPQ